MFETYYDPIRTTEQDDEELRRRREEEQQALILRQQQMMEQDMENGANAGTGTSSTRPVEPNQPEFRITPVEDLSKYRANITPQGQQLPRGEAPIQSPQALINTNPQVAPVPQPITPQINQPVQPQQVQPQVQIAQPQVQPQIQQAPQIMPAQAPVQQAPAQGPVAPMIAGTPTSDVGLTPTEQAVKQLSQQQQPIQQQAPQGPIAPNTTPTPGTTSQQVAQDLENGSYAATKTIKAYDILGSDNPDKMELGKIAYGDYAPHFRLAAEQRLEELKKKTKITEDGTKLIEGVQRGDPTAVRKLQKDINNPNPNEGSVGKLLLASLLGNKEAQTAELAKFGIGSTVHPYIGEDGQEYMVTTDAKGRAISGISSDGRVLPINELSNIAAGNLKTARTTAIHAYDSEKSRLTKERDAWVSRGLTEDQLAARGLSEDQIENKAQLRYNDTLKMASAYGNIKRDTSLGQSQIAGKPPVEKAKTDVSGGHKGFDSSVARTMKFEGGYVENDAGRGPTKFGINQESNPKVDVKNLTKEQALKIYKEKYWNGVNGIDNLSPKSQDLIFDASVNQGVDYANRLLAEVGDNPEAIVARREADYRDLAQRRPEKAKYLNGWIKRLEHELDAPITGGKTEPKSILDNWDVPRKGEQPKDFDKRTVVTADEIDSLARGLTDGSLTPGDLTGRDSNVRRYVIQRAKEIDPSWSATDSVARRDALKKFTNPDSQVSKQIRAHITSANAITDVEAAYKALQNNNIPLFNQLKNSFRANTGSELPIEAKTGAMILGPEIIKSIIPGGGGVTERLEAQHLMNTKLSPKQQEAVFKVLKEFQGNALLAIENDWTKAKLPKDQFRERVLGDAPAAQELLDETRTKRATIEQAKKEAKTPAGPNPAGARAELERRRKEQQ